MTILPTPTIDGIAMPSDANTPSHRFWGSSRMVYTICAFSSMVLQLWMRNTLNFVILCMVKHDVRDGHSHSMHTNWQMDQQCGELETNGTSFPDKGGDLEWTRSQEFTLQGMFYYGYVITLPIAGIFADRFGGKFFFVHSITAQAVVFMTLPFLANISFTAIATARVMQGLISGCGNPAMYVLFLKWAHPTERTALMSFAYGGYSVGTILTFPISSLFCDINWRSAFYCIGGVSLLCGIGFNWLVYNSPSQHPRISSEEYDYLKSENSQAQPSITSIPWKSISTSVPVYAFTLTHIFHNYGLIVLTLMTPRFFKEALRFPLSQIGLLSSAPFVGAFISKAVTIRFCIMVEKRPNLNLTKFRRITYVLCNCVTILSILGIIFFECDKRIMIVILITVVGAAIDLGFSGGYWSSLLFVAPSYSGFLSGLANSLSTISGVLAPYEISKIVSHGSKTEWNYVMITLAVSYALGAAIYGMYGSSKLQYWDSQISQDKKLNAQTQSEDGTFAYFKEEH